MVHLAHVSLFKVSRILSQIVQIEIANWQRSFEHGKRVNRFDREFGHPHRKPQPASDQKKCFIFARYYVLLPVSEHMGWVRNVVLMNVYSGLEKPQGVRISDGGPDGQVRETKGSVYEQPEKEGSK
jgi:hypothetical protein